MPESMSWDFNQPADKLAAAGPGLANQTPVANDDLLTDVDQEAMEQGTAATPVTLELPTMDSGELSITSLKANEQSFKTATPRLIRQVAAGPDDVAQIYSAYAGDQNYANRSYNDTPYGENNSNGQTEGSTNNHDGIIVISNAHLKFVDDIEIVAQTDGMITELTAEEGNIIPAGQILVQLDSRLPKAELEVANQELQVSREKSKDESELQYAKAASNVADQDFETSKELKRRGVESDQDYNKKWLEKRRSGLAIPVAELKQREAAGAVGINDAKVKMAETQISFRTIPAPFTGIVAEKLKDRYDWVRAGEPLLRLVSLNRLRVVGQVRTVQLEAPPHMLMGAPATVEVELFPGSKKTLQAKVGFVSPVMQSSDAYKIWLEIDNEQANNQWLFREGMTATVSINTVK